MRLFGKKFIPGVRVEVEDAEEDLSRVSIIRIFIRIINFYLIKHIKM
jgi:hypothetical protein